MKFTTDNLKVGDYIISNRSPIGTQNLGFARTVSYKIVFQIPINNYATIGICNFLTDGFTRFNSFSMEDMCQYLNNADDWRKLTEEEIIKLLDI